MCRSHQEQFVLITPGGNLLPIVPVVRISSSSSPVTLKTRSYTIFGGKK